MSDRREEIIVMKLISGEEIIAMKKTHESIEMANGSGKSIYTVSCPVRVENMKPWLISISLKYTLYNPVPIPVDSIILVTSQVDEIIKETYLDLYDRVGRT